MKIMKKIGFVILLLFPLINCAQKYEIQLTPVGLVFMSGFAKGYNDVLSYHYSSFKRVHPNVNDQWWNPSISWTNKYKNGIPPTPKFFLSTTLFVVPTDAKHTADFVHKWPLMGALVVKIGDPHEKWIYYLYDLVIYSATYNLGFALPYEWAYKPK